MLIDNKFAWCDELEAYLIPLFAEEDLPKGTESSEILYVCSCAKCGNDTTLLTQSLDELIMDMQYIAYSTPEETPVLGICTKNNCHFIINITDEIKYLL